MDRLGGFRSRQGRRTGLLLTVILSGLLAGCNPTTSEPRPSGTTSLSGPAWVVDPDVPGSDKPPIGRSLFDYLVTEPRDGTRTYKVPFPFAALVEKIEGELSADDGRSPMKRVLIPINRSLQRHAAKPDYFAYPRAVVAVDSQPPMREGRSGLLLADRLFLGYQEKSELVEVISYNEAAGRFEFQLVTDYAPGKTPLVQYANRALCTTCHQNQSPIFSRPLWEETNANPAIAALLEGQGRMFYGFPIRQGVDVPNAIDEATNQANRLSAYQMLWREGCQHSQSQAESIRCRAELFRLVLQARLSAAGFQEAMGPGGPLEEIQSIVEAWKARWPGGLLIPDPDVRNRDPMEFFSPSGEGQRGAWVQRATFSGRRERPLLRSVFEPSLPRTPLETWTLTAESRDLERVAIGLGQFLADVDVHRLDDHLFQQGVSDPAESVQLHTDCEADVRYGGNALDRVILNCAPAVDKPHNTGTSFSMDGVLYVTPSGSLEGTLDRLSFSGGSSLTDLKIAAGRVTVERHRATGRAEVMQKATDLHARLATGQAIKDFTFNLSSRQGNSSEGRATRHFVGPVTMTILKDFAPVQRAIEVMVEETIAGTSDVLADRPFRRAALMRALFEQVGLGPLTWCCDDDRGMPAVRLATAMHDHAETTESGETREGAIKLFQKYCAECHHEELPFPPNFLHGSAQQVEAQLGHCAERVFVRLSMWDRIEHERAEVPMPPVMALRRQQIAVDRWPSHGHLVELRKYAADSLRAEHGRVPELNELLSRGYDNLRECLPLPQVSATSPTHHPKGRT